MVKLTNAPEGRTYMIKSEVIDPDVMSGKKPSRHGHRYYDQDEYVVVEIPYVVPNGKWVMERPSGLAGPVGAKWSELESVQIDTRYGLYRMLHSSDKPFGYITAENWQFDELGHAVPVGNRRLFVAQKIHKGELLPGLSIPSIEIVRQAPDLSRKHGDMPRGRDQKRNHIRWARLTDVIAASGLSAEEVLLGYWPFIGWSIDHSSGRHGTQLHVVYAATAEEFRRHQPGFTYNNQEESAVIAAEPQLTAHAWIRAGLAKTILRLQALGVQPEVMHPA